MASFVNAAVEEIGFSWTTSSAWLAAVCRLNIAGKRLLVAAHEWGSNLAVLVRFARDAGAMVQTLPALDFPNPYPAACGPLIDDDVAAISLPMVTSVYGHRYPVEAIGALPRPDHCRLIVDAAQALGRVPVDVAALNCDFLVATCRKWLRGPRGTAMFWVAADAAEVFPVNAIEPFDASVSSRLGLGVAIREAAGTGLDEIGRCIRHLSEYTHGRATDLGLDTLTGAPPETVTLCLAIADGVAARIRQFAGERDIRVKWPDPAAGESRAGDRVEGHSAMRVSPHVDNTVAETDAPFDCVSSALARR